MRFNPLRYGAGLVLSGVVLFAAGCGGASDKTGQAQDDGEESGQQQIAAADRHNLHGWWCTEHGVPEEECSLCSAEAAEEFKAKGDWCVEHQRADSQCFICHPELKEKYAARYEAKFGEKPPEPAE